MSTQPRIEARIGAQERLTTILHARIEELSQDLDAARSKLDERFDGIDAHLGAVDTQIAAIREEVAAIRANIATKEDLAALQAVVLDAFKQLMAAVSDQDGEDTQV
jgi:chromosome segregation ATPase